MNQAMNNSSSINGHHRGNDINNERMIQPCNYVTDVTDAHTSTADGIDSEPYLMSSGAKKKQRRKRRRINSKNNSPVEFHSATSYGDNTMPQAGTTKRSFATTVSISLHQRLYQEIKKTR